MSAPSGDYTTLVPVTGEAVALDLRVAQFPSRTLALALDLLVQLGAFLLLVLLSSAISSKVDPAAGAAIGLVSVVAIIVGLPTLVETLTRGRSLGKMAAGLRVVRDDGGPVRFRHSFVRALFMIVDFWISSGAVGLISALVSTRGKRLGDHFAGTVVIRERVPSANGVQQLTYVMPPPLEPWAASLDLARLPDVTALQARQFLARAGTLAPEVRATMGRQLAAEVSSYVAPPAPSGVPAETYLMAVLTERLRRATAARPGALRPTPPVSPGAGPGPVGPQAAAPAAAAPAGVGPPGAASGPPADGPFALPR
ncbi:MAG TPA: RDD family protein [Candidatus Nanopelagicales bacterium]